MQSEVGILSGDRLQLGVGRRTHALRRSTTRRSDYFVLTHQTKLQTCSAASIN